MNKSDIIVNVKKFFSKFKKLNDKELSKVSGAGNEPEEFEWKPKGYVTPVKEQDEKDGWAFGSIGNQDNNTNNPLKK